MEDSPQNTQAIPEGSITAAQAKLFEALSKAQAEYPPVERSKTVSVYSKKTGTTYQFKYAPLEKLLDAIRKPFSNHGLCVFQQVIGNGDSSCFVVTTIGHKDGATISDRIPVTRTGDMKAFGGDITYTKRYGLSALAGIVADDDIDSVAEGERVTDVSGTDPDVVEKIESATSMQGLMIVWKGLSGAQRKAHAHIKDAQKAFIQEVDEAAKDD